MYWFSLETVFTLTCRLLAVRSMGDIRVFRIEKVPHEEENS